MREKSASSVESWVERLSSVFTNPSLVSMGSMLAGWALCTAKHTVTGIVRAAGAEAKKHVTSYHRLFRAARWTNDGVGRVLVELVDRLLDAAAVIVAPLDDSLCRHTGKHIAGASMHHDPLLSTAKTARFHFGHVWVVLSVVVTVRRWNKSFAVPVLCRMYRSCKVCEREGVTLRKKTELAADMICVLARWLPRRRFVVVCDTAYTTGTVVRTLPPNVELIGRSRPDAALYAPPGARRSRGRPRVKGRRLPSPQARAASGRGWKRLRTELYGRRMTLRVKTFDALWYIVGRGRLLRFVLVRGWPGHDHDDVFMTTDLTADAGTILERFCLRWKLEVTFEEVKGRLGFEDPHCRSSLAVERTAPMALWVYTLCVVWYVEHGSRLRLGRLTTDPWYPKTVPAFSDMLAALRRLLWTERILDPLQLSRRDQKSIRPLLEAAARAA